MKATVKKAYGIASKTVELSLVDIMAINNAKQQVSDLLAKIEKDKSEIGIGFNSTLSNADDTVLINTLYAMKNLLTRLGIEELNLQPSDIFDDVKEPLVEDEE